MEQPRNRDAISFVLRAMQRADGQADGDLFGKLVTGLNLHLMRLTAWHFWKSTGGTVSAGPFSGMRLHDGWKQSPAPCLLGTYEVEIQDWIEDVVAAAPPLFVDVGCGDGYYPVGMARRLPALRCIAADTDEQAQAATRAQAALNGVGDRVAVMGGITPAVLQSLLCPGAVVLVDCEGYEDTLLDPAAVPALADAMLIVELHDFIIPGVSERIIDRFAPTHRVEIRKAADRNGLDVPAVAGLPPVTRFLALNEGRPPMQWARLTPQT